jgi:hypothetical protein
VIARFDLWQSGITGIDERPAGEDFAAAWQLLAGVAAITEDRAAVELVRRIAPLLAGDVDAEPAAAGDIARAREAAVEVAARLTAAAVGLAWPRTAREVAA